MKPKIVVVLAIILVAAACAPKPEPLRYAIIPAEEASLSQEQFEPFIKYLSGALGREVELLLVADYTAVVEAMKYGHADVARFGPFSYVLAAQEADVEAVAPAVKESTGRAAYHALIVARADRHVADLNGASLAYVDPASTSGYLSPATYLMEAEIKPDEIFFAGTHSAVIEAVKNGTVDAGAVADNRYLVALAEGVIGEGELEILWESDPIPNSPVAVQKAMDAGLKAKLVAALLATPREVLEHTGAGEIGFVEVDDGDYDVVRRMQEAKEILDSD